MTIAAPVRERIVGALLVVAACLYLIPFVPRGWIPHDEGMLGQSADRVLHGAMPHLDYGEPYTGGLSWLYAAVFRLRGVDLLHVRWLLFLGACVAAWLVYTIVRRYLPPRGAALATWVAGVWSFPNYFAGLPSWWLLVCALAGVWGVIRYSETSRLRFLIVAGAAAGIAMTIKQTGVYVFIALMLTLAYDRGHPLLRWAAATAAIAVAARVLAPRLFAAEGLYLFCPAAACALPLVAPADREPRTACWTAIAVAGAAAALPVLVLLTPYLVHHRLWDFVNGAVLLPQRRLGFASAPMPPAWLVVSGLPLVALVFSEPRTHAVSMSPIGRILLWAVAIGLPIAALWNVASYKAIWQSSRAFAALLPLVVYGLLATRRPQERRVRTILFAMMTMLAWTSINQFPFAAPIYFSYVTPLAVIAAVAAAHRSGTGRETMMPVAVMLVLFAVLSTNRAYIESLGVSHAPRRFDAPLDLPRAHLMVAEGDARTYQRLVAAIGRHLRGGQLVAGPDCPEVYFLAGLTNPSGALFDFLSDHDAAAWTAADVIIVNHEPHFSPRPSDRLLATLRREFPHNEDFGRFEVRWR